MKVFVHLCTGQAVFASGKPVKVLILVTALAMQYCVAEAAAPKSEVLTAKKDCSAEGIENFRVLQIFEKSCLSADLVAWSIFTELKEKGSTLGVYPECFVFPN